MDIMSSDNQDKLCNVCGHIGFEEVLVTCSRCSTACEHVYCMKVYNTKLPEKWICEACANTSDGTPDPDWNDNIFIPARTRKSCDDLVRRFNCNQPMAVRNSKVKFLPSEEAIRLTSEVFTSQRSAFGQNPALSKSIVPILRKTSPVSSAVVPKFPPPKSKPYPRLFPSRLLRDGSTQLSSARNQKTSVVSKNSQAHAGEHICVEQFFEAISPAEEVEGPGVTNQKAMNQPCKASPSGYHPNIFRVILPSKELEKLDTNKGKTINKPLKGSSSRLPAHIPGAILSAKVAQTTDTNKGKTMNKPCQGSSSSNPANTLAAILPAKQVKTCDTNKENAMMKPCKGSSSSSPVNIFEAILPAKEVQMQYNDKEKATNEPCQGSSSRHPPSTFGSGSKFQEAAKAATTNPEKRDQLLEKLSFYRYHLPAKNSIWRGCIKFRSTTDQCEYCYEFRAQPPCRAHSKATEFSKKMPPILQARLLRREHIWVDLFQHDYPDLNDIALYFFPSTHIERARQKIANLAVLLESQNSVMICNMDNVELLIFTSKRLHVDAKDVLRMAKTPCLLWGLFRRVKGGGVDDSNVDLTGRDGAVLQDSSKMLAGSSRPRGVARRLPPRYREPE
ncbi:hypothetical protein HS088_TW15G00143 [Tripterygium wilfordii]|uniref:AIPP2-like SPOC-like domain-containing protein n=1 Tax=Tripterygium wilfordii TaxID=458696 RepID=A0A7J7CKV3_TRIWF|nr:uncharacterized protein LOC120017006 [Tripterygium wilfordii]KAF5734651.1 hypothetical protein HS088_TW15G00143 [Tripterygium wilfordii]